MQLRVSHRNGEFFVRFGPNQGSLNYKVYGNQMIVDDPDIPREFENRGAASALMRAAVEFARKNALKISIETSIAQSWKNSHNEDRDVFL